MWVKGDRDRRLPVGDEGRAFLPFRFTHRFHCPTVKLNCGLLQRQPCIKAHTTFYARPRVKSSVTSRALARPGRYSQFFNFYSGPRLLDSPLFSLVTTSSSRGIAVYAFALLFSLPTHFFPRRAGAYLRDDDKSVTVAQFAKGDRHRARVLQRARVQHDNIYKLIFCVSFLIKYSCYSRYGNKRRALSF